MGNTRQTWTKVMAHKKNDTRHVKGDVANNLTDDEVITIVATADFFGASSTMLAQIVRDLGSSQLQREVGISRGLPCRYRVFDWLAMMIQTEDRILKEHNAIPAIQVFTHSFLKNNGDIDLFIKDLRTTDYDIDRSWELIDINK